METSRRLAGKVALVTGASRGLGAAMAERFVAEGARAVFSMDIAAPEREVAGVRWLSGDVSRPEDCRGAVEAVLAACGRIDVLVNNAGIGRPGTAHGARSLDHWREVLAVNLTGAFQMIHAVLPGMMASPGGAVILNVASIAAEVVNPVIHPGYAASKGALVSLTRHLAATHAKFGIRACAIAPGAVRTALWDGLPADVQQRYGDLHPLGVGDPGDVAALAAFLVSDEARWITGTVVHLDGGNLCAGGLAAYAREVVS
ncbi:MAG TPA: SDR family oxidoreductase [Kofleriaceae bacterium]|nr:SDR family oxidoreductase [Kofleriaceae bacterium]